MSPLTSMRAFPLLAIAIAAVALGGCASPTPYPCENSSNCEHDGLQGMCEATGYCSFPDTKCSGSYRRYGTNSPKELANQCLPAAPGGDCVAQVSNGGEHTCVLKKDHTVWCWGSNETGQLGTGDFTSSPVPVMVQNLPAGDDVEHVSAGESHTCVITSAGKVYCWGSNATGQLGAVVGGDPTVMPLVPVDNSPAPVQVVFDNPDDYAVQIAAGADHTCATTKDGDAHCWGANGYGQLGTGDKDELPIPGEVSGLEHVAEIVPGDEHTCAITDDGRIFCFGSNKLGQAGLGPDVIESLNPVQITKVTSAKKVVAGDEHTCLVRADQTVWCWGYNASGSVGNGSDRDVYDPLQVSRGATVVTGSTSFHTCALVKSNGGELWCWGANENGQVGVPPSKAIVLSPTRSALPAATTRIAVGTYHSCAVTVDGSLWCWGANSFGQLGNGVQGESTFVPQAVTICP
jgi:alpha-tubulin suppressor-like RCC1 family protein